MGTFARIRALLKKGKEGANGCEASFQITLHHFYRKSQ